MDKIQTALPVLAALAIVAFALPSYLSVIRQRGVKGVLLLVSLAVFVLAFLTVALKVKLPFGAFHFGDSLGYKLLGSTPWVTAFAYPPIVLGAYWLARKFTNGTIAVMLTAIVALAIHSVTDPALARMSLWSWDNSGPFYGVPVLNFVGWLLAWLIGAAIVHGIWLDDPLKRSTAWSAFGITWFWSGVNLGLQQWVPGAVGVALGVLFLILMWLEKRRSNREQEV